MLQLSNPQLLPFELRMQVARAALNRAQNHPRYTVADLEDSAASAELERLIQKKTVGAGLCTRIEFYDEQKEERTDYTAPGFPKVPVHILEYRVTATRHTGWEKGEDGPEAVSGEFTERVYVEVSPAMRLETVASRVAQLVAGVEYEPFSPNA